MTCKASMLGLLIFLVLWVSRARGEFFTAISEVEHLLETHKRIIDYLDHYIEKEELRIRELKRHLKLYRTEHEKAMEDIPNYLGNPINAFTLIKRLTTDLDLIEDSINVGTEYVKNITMTHKDMKYPSTEDLNGAALALIRLQKTYHLEVEELAQGMLNGVQYSTPLTASDCYEIGKVLYNEKKFANSLEWMMVTLKKMKDAEEFYTFTEIDVLEYIGFSHYILGETEAALEWTKRLLELDPEHVRARGNIPHYEKDIREAQQNDKRVKRGDTGDPQQSETHQEEKLVKERETYEHLCRGETEIDPEISKRLKCWYETKKHPFLKYAPMKVEQSYINPDIFIFHEVMSDYEIETVKKMAMPRFKRAVVHEPSSGKLVPAHYRISKSAWLRDEEAATVARISRRVEHMTGLSVSSAEELQVVNYGIGGHYEPHFDYARKMDKAFTSFEGNRIATVLFYMSDVAQGGATVFTEIGLSLFPIKGAAAFWLNLHSSGEGDALTRHAACPVLRGSKWVSNKWLHEGGQEFIRPCELVYRGEDSARPLAYTQPVTAR